jgi:hypothetical protein
MLREFLGVPWWQIGFDIFVLAILFGMGANLDRLNRK